MDKELIKAIKNISTGIDKMEKVLTRQLKDINKNIQRKDTVEDELDNQNQESYIYEQKDRELIYIQTDAIDFIKAKFEEDGKSEVTRGVIKDLLKFEEDYMRNVEIIKD